MIRHNCYMTPGWLAHSLVENRSVMADAHAAYGKNWRELAGAGSRPPRLTHLLIITHDNAAPNRLLDRYGA